MGQAGNREAGTYDAEEGRVLESGEQVRQENGRVRLGGRSDHDGVRTDYRTYSTRIFDAYTVVILDCARGP